jgi:hypothetical protein
MSRFVMVVLTNPVTDQDDAYNEWYDNEHVRDVVSVDGFLSGQRFRLTTTGIGNVDPPSHRYLALYEVEAESAAVANDSLVEAARQGRLRGHEALDLSTIATWLFEPISDLRLAIDRAPTTDGEPK